LKKIVFFLFIIAFSSIVYAQQPVSIHLTEKDGLPDNEFYNVLEDSKGYIWLAADKGLFRFDGTTYKKFQHTDQIGLSVFQLHEDINGAIWYTNLSNQVFYIKEEKITLFNTNPVLNKFRTGLIINLLIKVWQIFK
jgi:ligand-binding sensor domain-containing protein